MRLSDIMGHMNLSVYPQVALVIFAGVFVLVVGRALGRSRAGELRDAARLPLSDGPTAGHTDGRGAR